jgi:hypothetical protein
MKRIYKWLIYSVLTLVIIFLVGTWAWRYATTGIIIPFGSASCGENFENGFKQAVAANNPSFCLSADLQNINQYRNIYGYPYCSIPVTGHMTTNAGAGLSRGNIDQCLETMAVATQNVESCDLIKDSLPKDSCYFVLARNTHNPSYCSQVSDISTKNICLTPEWYMNSPRG